MAFHASTLAMRWTNNAARAPLFPTRSFNRIAARVLRDVPDNVSRPRKRSAAPLSHIRCQETALKTVIGTREDPGNEKADEPNHVGTLGVAVSAFASL